MSEKKKVSKPEVLREIRDALVPQSGGPGGATRGQGPGRGHDP